MKFRLYWRTLSPWLLVPVAILSIPFIVIYMLIFHPRRCIQAWRQRHQIY